MAIYGALFCRQQYNADDTDQCADTQHDDIRQTYALSVFLAQQGNEPSQMG